MVTPYLGEVTDQYDPNRLVYDDNFPEYKKLIQMINFRRK